MKQKLALALYSLALLLIGGAAGVLIGMRLPPGIAKNAPPAQRIAGVPASPVTAPPRTQETGPRTPVTAPQKTAKAPPNVPMPPRVAGTLPPTNTGNANSPSRPPFAGGQQRNSAAFEKLRPKTELMRLFQGVGRLDELKAPLTPAQAKAILVVINPLRKQAILSADQAAKVLPELQAQLTKAQQDAIAQAPRNRMRRGGAGRPGGNQPGGPNAAGNNGGEPPRAPGTDGPPRRRRGDGEGGPGGGEPGGFFAQMETMNPFNTSGETPMADRYKAIFDALEAKAHQ